MFDNDYGTEAEHLSEIYDGVEWDDEERDAYYELQREWRPTTRNQRKKKKKQEQRMIKELPKLFAKHCEELYYIIQDSRIDNTTLMLVDRRKSKQYFWTHDHSIALTCQKAMAEQILSKLKFNSARMVKVQEYSE